MRHREALHIYLVKLVHGEEPGILAVLLLGLLRFLSAIYAVGVSIKLNLYKYGIL